MAQVGLPRPALSGVSFPEKVKAQAGHTMKFHDHREGYRDRSDCNQCTDKDGADTSFTAPKVVDTQGNDNLMEW